MEWMQTFFPQPNTYTLRLNFPKRYMQKEAKCSKKYSSTHARNKLTWHFKKGMTFIDRPPFHMADKIVLQNISLSICKYFIVDMIRLHTLSTNHRAYFTCLNRFDILGECFFVRLNCNAKRQVDGE